MTNAYRPIVFRLECVVWIQALSAMTVHRHGSVVDLSAVPTAPQPAQQPPQAFNGPPVQLFGGAAGPIQTGFQTPYSRRVADALVVMVWAVTASALRGVRCLQTSVRGRTLPVLPMQH
jgi:hypothetical protein